MTPRFHVATFGTGAFGTRDYRHAIRYQRRQALRFGAASHQQFDERSDEARRALAENPHVAPRDRGYGYWIWKPYVIAGALRRIAPGELLLYIDAGVAPIADLTAWMAALADAPMAFFHPQLLPMRHWTKRDCFVGMDMDDAARWNAPTLSGGLQVYRHCPEAFAFLDELRGLMRDPRLLTDQPNTLGRPDLDGFVEHRHDQSILTLLAMRHGQRIALEPTQYGGGRQLLDVHRVAHRRLVRHLLWRARRAYGRFRHIDDVADLGNALAETPRPKHLG